MPLSLIAWAIACVIAFSALWAYANTPATHAEPKPGWSPPEALRVPSDRACLVLFAHPKCPCTRATMAALERLRRDHSGLLAMRVVFYEPINADASWRGTELWERALALEESLAIADPGGAMSMAAGAVASGTVIFMDHSGQERFRGGITPARGHEGDSVGSIAIRAILRGESPGHNSASVYGCRIVGAEETPAHRGSAEQRGAGDAD
ncbi:MAG: hypothetical protein ACTS3F_05335 [Phycisphaerales bacterium]